MSAPKLSLLAFSLAAILAWSGHVALAERAPRTEFRATFPIAAFVAEVEVDAVVSDQWIEAQLATTNRIFAPVGLSFRLAERHALEERHARLETRRDRHALGAHLHEGVINWFVVLSLRDVDEPERYRRGVHWRPRGLPGRHFVVVSSIAGERVLAHELGHFFGNRTHPEVAGNIMSYLGSEAEPSFDGAQTTKIRRFARRFVESGELVTLDDD